MKKLVYLSIFLPLGILAQTAIGKTSVSNSSVSLEFGTGSRGIVLPYVANVSAMTGAVPGTVVFDASTGIAKYCTEPGVWSDLTKNVQNFVYGASAIADTTGYADTSVQAGLADQPSKKAVIGATSDASPGALVLSATDRAMVLPKVASPHLNIVSPAPGMMVYDTATNQLAVFNGTVWSFWRP